MTTPKETRRYVGLGAVPRGYKPPSTGRILVKNFAACPTCMAPLGEPCYEGRGAYHIARRRLAIRAQSEGA